LKANHAQSLCH